MDKDTKNFFEKLAGINDEEENEEIGRFMKPEKLRRSDTSEVGAPTEASGEFNKKTTRKTSSKKNQKKESEEEIIEPEEETEDDEEENSLSEIFEEGEGELAIDFYQTLTHLVIESTIAGVEPENIDVNITPE